MTFIQVELLVIAVLLGVAVSRLASIEGWVRELSQDLHAWFAGDEEEGDD